MTSLLALANDLKSRSEQLEHIMIESGVPMPSWKADAPPDFVVFGQHYDTIQTLRFEMIDALNNMNRLLCGPIEVIKDLTSGAPVNSGAMRVIVNYNVAKAVPLTGEISFEHLAEKTGLDLDMLHRLVSYCTSAGIFQIIDSSFVGHTAASAVLAHGPFANTIHWDVNLPALTGPRLYDALQKFSVCDSPHKSAFNVAYSTNETFYEYHNSNKEASKLFSNYMASEFAERRSSAQNALTSYDWQQLEGKLVVDLGGSSGHVSQIVATAFPAISFIVQDLPETIKVSKDQLPTDLNSRIEFQEHDFFQPQPTVADAYFLRYILHNWSDDDCIKIIAALHPALRPGARLLINETISPDDSNMSEFEERLFKRRDIQMMIFMGARERTVANYDRIITAAQPRFKYVGLKRPIGCCMAIIEWRFE